MNTIQKVKILAESSKYDLCASSSSKRKVKTDDRIGNPASGGICHSFTADGRCISLYKTLMTNKCNHDCKYCQNSGCNRKTTASFDPDELARTFMRLYLGNYVEGLFLSSGISKNSDVTTERMLDCVKLIRDKYHFQGYVHLKVLPGVNQSLIKEGREFADRMSINLEAANASRIKEITNIKNFKSDIIRRQRWINKERLPSGQTTQFVVGSCDETDKEIISTVKWEYDNVKLRRAYFSNFTPIKNTPFENKKRSPMHREVRLYNTDWLMRVYKFRYREIMNILDENDNLPKEDPKIHIARNYFDRPIDLNEASYDELIRIPGIGLTSTYKIMELQEKKITIEKRSQLKNMGIVLKRAEPFLKINGVNQTTIASFT